MPIELKDLADEMHGVWSEMQTELKTYGAQTGESKAAIEKFNARLDQIEVEIKRAQTAARVTAALDAAEPGPERKAFIQALRKGLVTLRHEDKDAAQLVKIASPGEAKALSLGDDTAGGFLAPPEFVNDIIKAIVLMSPLRQYATVRKTSNRSVQIPVRKGTYAATWVSETGTRSETTGLKYGLEELPNHEMYSEVLISNQDLEDAAFDMDAQLNMEASEQFAVTEGAAFINGTGVGQPEGVLTNSAVASAANGNATVLQYAGLTDFFYGLKSGYAANATWVMNRATIGKMREVTDSQGRPIWEPGFPGFTGAAPATIFGRPYAEMPDMPNVASGTYPIALGDFKRCYTIVDRVQLVVQRLVEKYAEQGQVAYLVRKRVGGQVTLADGIIKLHMA